jgi:hypothetical protein
MATSGKTTTKRAKAAAQKLAFADMSPSQQAAEEILMRFPDLTPSVSKIMTADLSEDQRLRVITQFRTALTTVGDPNRDPRYAIANCEPDERA